MDQYQEKDYTASSWKEFEKVYNNVKAAWENENTSDNVQALTNNLKEAAKAVFGSGYAYLASDMSGKMHIIMLKNQETPIEQRLNPLLPIDMWEHAYYLQFQYHRDRYINNFCKVINWKEVEKNYYSWFFILSAINITEDIIIKDRIVPSIAPDVSIITSFASGVLPGTKLWWNSSRIAYIKLKDTLIIPEIKYLFFHTAKTKYMVILIRKYKEKWAVFLINKLSWLVIVFWISAFIVL